MKINVTKSVMLASVFTLCFMGSATADSPSYHYNKFQPKHQSRSTLGRSADRTLAPYIGINLSQNRVEINDLSGKLRPTALGLTAGISLTPHLAAELRLSSGISDSSKSIDGNGDTAKLKLKQKLTYGLYLKGIVPVTRSFSLYALVGGTHFKAELKGKSALGSVSETDSDSDFSYGAGLIFDASMNTSINLEYARLYNKDDIDIRGLLLGINYHF